ANAEGVSRYHLALEIQKEVERSGAQILCKRIDPAPSVFFAMRAKRPPYSVLATEKFTAITGKMPRPWKEAMRCYLHDATLF
ncbi:MAG: sugar nucleotide-binding protein, partial [Chlamydiales bacterium]|nr:sugar nucleotide-binding protein [Chlamydiales bacterium]